MTAANRAAAGTYKKTTLKNGLRVITESLPAVRSVSLGVWVDVGSRHETNEENGVSHLIEHMVFKGTGRRSSRDIASSLESLGGALNGWTSRENTCYTARVLDEHLGEAVDVLADIACNPRMTAHNLNREKLVICEEIKESLDNPGDKIHDLFARVYWGDHPLGNTIMGSQDNILNMTRARMMNYYRRGYSASNVVVAASGAVSHNKLVRLAREKFSFAEGNGTPAQSAEKTRSATVKVVRDKGAQTHLCLGLPGVAYGDANRMAVHSLVTYLGGGMSSVLFQKIREEKGLAYSVYCFHDYYADAGIFGTYMGTDGKAVPAALDIIRREFNKVKKRKLDSARLEQVKAQMKGQVMLALESTYNRMSRIARMELVMGQYLPLAATLKAIDAITPSDVLAQANAILHENAMAIAVLGPVKASVIRDVA
jgi:predicted Zn-dependent peptidase